jgi:hypothetical protein
VQLEQARRATRDVQARQRIRFARELQVSLFEMIQIQMTVTTRPHEIAALEIALCGDHVREQGVLRRC